MCTSSSTSSGVLPSDCWASRDTGATGTLSLLSVRCPDHACSCTTVNGQADVMTGVYRTRSGRAHQQYQHDMLS